LVVWNRALMAGTIFLSGLAAACLPLAQVVALAVLPSAAQSLKQLALGVFLVMIGFQSGRVETNSPPHGQH
jgi:hypothetical protein